jgi:hypothetical protein
MKLWNAQYILRYAQRRNTHGAGRGQTTWREMTKICGDVWVWELISAGENALERGDGDTRIEKITRDTKGKKDVGISTRMRGQWLIELYVE